MNEYNKGVVATAIFILILGTIPAITRLAVTTQLTVWDLWLMRCAVGGLIFLPFFVVKIKRGHLPPKMLVTGFFLAACQGWGAHLSSIGGMQFAPTSHTSALGPGVISLWVAMWGYLIYRSRPSTNELMSFPILIIGAGIIMANSGFLLSDYSMLVGDALYLTSSCISAIYLVYLKNNRLDPLTGAAMISVFSGLMAGAIFTLAPVQSNFAQATVNEILLHTLVQGVIAGALIYWLIGYAIPRIGAQQFTIIGTLIPVLSIITGRHIAGDPYNYLDWLAILIIGIGIFVGIRRPALQHAGAVSNP